MDEYDKNYLEENRDCNGKCKNTLYECHWCSLDFLVMGSYILNKHKHMKYFNK